MIYLEVIVLVSSLYCIYEALTYIGIWGMPYISSLSNFNIYFTVIKVCALKWAIPLGVFGLVFSIVSLFLFRKNPDFNRYRLFTAGFYLFITLIMLF